MLVMLDPLSRSQAAHRAEELKRAFMALKGEQEDMLGLLRTVSDSLEGCPSIGGSHPLYRKWQDIRQVSAV